MFDENSRYAYLPTRERLTPDGQRIVYVTRRIVPAAANYQRAGLVSVTDSDRLDLISYQQMGTPAAFWQIADANGAMHPDDLTAETLRGLVIPIPRHPESDK